MIFSHVIFYNIILCYVLLCYVILNYVISNYTILLYHYIRSVNLLPLNFKCSDHYHHLSFELQEISTKNKTSDPKNLKGCMKMNPEKVASRSFLLLFSHVSHQP